MTSVAVKPITFKSSILGTVELRSYVDPHPGLRGSDKVATACGRCGGRGRIEAYNHVYAGVCFECNGSGQGSVTVATQRKHAKADAYARDYSTEIAAYWDAEDARIAAEQAETRAKEEAEAQAKEAERLANLVQGHVGAVGEKITGVDIVVKYAQYNPGSYNRSSSMFIVAETTDGKAIKFGGSAASVMGLERGDKVTILTAKVKDHSEFRDQQQTVLSHVKVSEPVRDNEEDAE